MLGVSHDDSLKKNKKTVPTIIKIPPHLTNNRNIQLIRKIVAEKPQNCFFSTLYHSGYLFVNNDTPPAEVPISQMFDTSIILDGMERAPPTTILVGVVEKVDNRPSLDLSWMYNDVR